MRTEAETSVIVRCVCPSCAGEADIQTDNGYDVKFCPLCAGDVTPTVVPESFIESYDEFVHIDCDDCSPSNVYSTTLDEVMFCPLCGQYSVDGVEDSKEIDDTFDSFEEET